MAALYEFVRSITTRFGFLPEAYQRQGDIILCETCAIMDFLGLAVTLANHGYPQFWSDVERTTRNHLVESQVADGSWLGQCNNPLPDTHQFTWGDIAGRGRRLCRLTRPEWTACRETMIHWGGPEIRGKVRAFQNCCGGSGTHGLFIAWKNAARFERGELAVNMHIDKLLPQAEIRCDQPVRADANHAPPGSAPPFACGCRSSSGPLRFPCGAVAARAGRRVTAIQGRVEGHYLALGPQAAGTKSQLNYPLPVRDEEIADGNEGSASGAAQRGRAIPSATYAAR